MPALFRPSIVSCFFCQQAISPLPRDPRSFRCPHCACLNRYDSKGEILSDEPAMHDEALNSRSFAKRGEFTCSETSFQGSGLFQRPQAKIVCPLCMAQTKASSVTPAKQTRCYSPISSPTTYLLLRCVHLISCVHPLATLIFTNQDLDYDRRLETLPDYRNSLHARYPPVCDKCLPAVEEEIRSKNHMARTKALGGWLKQSKGKEKERKISGIARKRKKLGVQLVAWKIRGCLWAMTLLLAFVGNSTGKIYPCASVVMTNKCATQLPSVTLSLIKCHIYDPFYQLSL